MENQSVERAAWLEERRKSIGGSDAAGIVGLNAYSSPYSIWADKTGRLPEPQDNEAMRQGRDLEHYVAERWAEHTGKRCRRKNEMIRNPDYPFAHANIDRWVVGERAGLECKTTSVMNLKHFKNGEYPERYYCQCVHYMAVTGAERWYLGVLVLNQGFYSYVIERDEDEIAALMTAEREFWEYVKKDTPPPVDGSQATREALSAIYLESIPGSPLDLFGMDKPFERLHTLKSQIKDLERERDLCEQQLKQALGEAESGVCGCHSVTWKSQSRRTFDYKRFAEENPELPLEDYFKTTTFRKFDIKENRK